MNTRFLFLAVVLVAVTTYAAEQPMRLYLDQPGEWDDPYRFFRW